MNDSEGRKASDQLSGDNRRWGITGRKVPEKYDKEKRIEGYYDSWHSYWTDTTDNIRILEIV